MKELDDRTIKGGFSAMRKEAPDPVFVHRVLAAAAATPQERRTWFRNHQDVAGLLAGLSAGAVAALVLFLSIGPGTAPARNDSGDVLYSYIPVESALLSVAEGGHQK